MKNELVIVIDFGGQYNQLVARRVRECNVYCEIYSYKIGIDKNQRNESKRGIILTGGTKQLLRTRFPNIQQGIIRTWNPSFRIMLWSTADATCPWRKSRESRSQRIW